MIEVTLLRRGAVVRVPALELVPELPVVGHAFADLRFDDGHVERWLGPPILGMTTDDPDMATVVDWAHEDVVDEHDGFGIPAGALSRAPAEIVVEWGVPLPAELPV